MEAAALQTFEQRMGLRRHPQIQEALDCWWSLAVQHVGPRVHRLSTALHGFLGGTPDLDPGDRKQFLEGMFELADVWTETLDPTDYATFLNSLLARCVWDQRLLEHVPCAVYCGEADFSHRQHMMKPLRIVTPPPLLLPPPPLFGSFPLSTLKQPSSISDAHAIGMPAAPSRGERIHRQMLHQQRRAAIALQQAARRKMLSSFPTRRSPDIAAAAAELLSASNVDPTWTPCRLCALVSPPQSPNPIGTEQHSTFNEFDPYAFPERRSCSPKQREATKPPPKWAPPSTGWVPAARPPTPPLSPPLGPSDPAEKAPQWKMPVERGRPWNPTQRPSTPPRFHFTHTVEGLDMDMSMRPRPGAKPSTVHTSQSGVLLVQPAWKIPSPTRIGNSSWDELVAFGERRARGEKERNKPIKATGTKPVSAVPWVHAGSANTGWSILVNSPMWSTEEPMRGSEREFNETVLTIGSQWRPAGVAPGWDVAVEPYLGSERTAEGVQELAGRSGMRLEALVPPEAANRSTLSHLSVTEIQRLILALDNVNAILPSVGEGNNENAAGTAKVLPGFEPSPRPQRPASAASASELPSLALPPSSRRASVDHIPSFVVPSDVSPDPPVSRTPGRQLPLNELLATEEEQKKTPCCRLPIDDEAVVVEAVEGWLVEEPALAANLSHRCSPQPARAARLSLEDSASVANCVQGQKPLHQSTEMAAAANPRRAARAFFHPSMHDSSFTCRLAEAAREHAQPAPPRPRYGLRQPWVGATHPPNARHLQPGRSATMQDYLSTRRIVLSCENAATTAGTNTGRGGEPGAWGTCAQQSPVGSRHSHRHRLPHLAPALKSCMQSNGIRSHQLTKGFARS